MTHSILRISFLTMVAMACATTYARSVEDHPVQRCLAPLTTYMAFVKTDIDLFGHSVGDPKRFVQTQTLMDTLNQKNWETAPLSDVKVYQSMRYTLDDYVLKTLSTQMLLREKPADLKKNEALLVKGDQLLTSLNYGITLLRLAADTVVCMNNKTIPS